LVLAIIRLFLSLVFEFRKPKILEFILDNIFIIGLITGTIILFLAIVKFIEYRDAKKDKET